ncbi:MAG: divalent-cation tolerance protein CutA [Luteolibacter sp.]
MSDIRLILCTFPSVEEARQIGTTLVEKQLAACVNLIPGVESVYRWQGSVETAAETLAIIKTRATAADALSAALAELHPYGVPEIVVLDPAGVNESYRNWLLRET